MAYVYILRCADGSLYVGSTNDVTAVTGFSPSGVEHLQKHLAGELGTDPAATPCSQTRRLPGYRNHKYDPPHLVTVEYGPTELRYVTAGFPTPAAAAPVPQPTPVPVRLAAVDLIERARRYLARVEPAITGQHGDRHTFKVCCRIVRGFALSDEEAVRVLSEWNARCVPPWNERELRDKIARARKYGQEAIGAFR